MKSINKIKKWITDFLIILTGNTLLAFCSSFFFVNYKGNYVFGTNPNDVISFDGILLGGTGGLSLILNKLFFTASNSEFIVEIIIAIVTWCFFFLGLIFLGKKFALQTLISTIVYPIILFFFKFDIFDELREHIRVFNPTLCAIVGGLGMGAGCGIVYRIGGSTGGFDVPGLIFNKFTRIKLSLIFLIMDGILVALAFVAKYSLYEVVIGLLSVVFYSIAVDATQKIGNEAYYCDIISEKWQEINEQILAIDRGTTIVDVTGGYTNNQRKMIKTLVGKNQYLQILDIVKKIDPNAFMSLSRTSEVFGEGYRDITKFSNK